MTTKVVERPEPKFKPGDAVNVDGIGACQVIAVKPGARGWAVEVRNAESLVWVVNEGRCWK